MNMHVSPAATFKAAQQSDPIFAAIERFKRARVSSEKAYLQYDEVSGTRYKTDSQPKNKRERKLKKRWEAAEKEFYDARWALVNCVPTTAAGLAATLAYTRDNGCSIVYRSQEKLAYLASVATAAATLAAA